MKLTLALLSTLLALASATPAPRGGHHGGGHGANVTPTGCGTPGVYRCAPAKDTMEVCDFDGNWKRLDPGCPKDTECQPNPFGNNIPYCMVKTTNTGTGTPTGVGANCATAGQYTCTPDGKSIQVCDVSKKNVLVGKCPKYCSYIAGIPYCF
jgi:hypothetical protein